MWSTREFVVLESNVLPLTLTINYLGLIWRNLITLSLSLLEVRMFIPNSCNNLCGWFGSLFHFSSEINAKILTLYPRVFSTHVVKTTFCKPPIKPNFVTYGIVIWNGSISISSIGPNASLLSSIRSMWIIKPELLIPEESY